jgi:hypothetical protein
VQTGVDPSTDEVRLVADPDDARERWREHPLARATDMLKDVLGGLLYDARHVLVVSDADGCLLFSEGHPDVLRAAEGIRFSPGHAWSEADAGTNAVGTALALDGAVQVFSSEHFRVAVHGWQCSAAPVHDPDTGRTLGVIDITGAYQDAHPSTLGLVQTAARLVEQQLRTEMLERDARILRSYAEHTARHGGPAAAIAPSGRVLAATPADWRAGRIELVGAGAEARAADEHVGALHPLGDGLLLLPSVPKRSTARRPLRRARLLGASRATVVTPDGTRRVSQRHGELLALLALNPDGLSARELSQVLYGDGAHETGVRVELHRLRDVLGDALAARPYRLEDFETDLGVVHALLSEGRLDDAASACPGPLLPHSSVPAIVTARERLARELAAVAA